MYYSKIQCPLGGVVLYADCLECEDREACRSGDLNQQIDGDDDKSPRITPKA